MAVHSALQLLHADTEHSGSTLRDPADGSQLLSTLLSVSMCIILLQILLLLLQAFFFTLN